jgi:hypothetical protein
VTSALVTGEQRRREEADAALRTPLEESLALIEQRLERIEQKLG